MGMFIYSHALRSSFVFSVEHEYVKTNSHLFCLVYLCLKLVHAASECFPVRKGHSFQIENMVSFRAKKVFAVDNIY